MTLTIEASPGYWYVWLRQRMPSRVVDLLRRTWLLLLVRSLIPQRIGTFPLSGALRGHKLHMAYPYVWDMVHGTHEPQVCAVIQREVKPGWRCYDIGAHIGYFTLLLASLVGASGRVTAFEPLPSNVDLLRQNTALNGYKDRVRIEPVAVGAEDGHLPLYLNAQSSMASTSGLHGIGTGMIEVQTVALDSYISHAGDSAVHFVKIDVEGAGGEVLAGFHHSLEHLRPLILMEIHNEIERAYLEELVDYQVYQVKADGSLMLATPDTKPSKGPEHLLARPLSEIIVC